MIRASQDPMQGATLGNVHLSTMPGAGYPGQNYPPAATGFTSQQYPPATYHNSFRQAHPPGSGGYHGDVPGSPQFSAAEPSFRGDMRNSVSAPAGSAGTGRGYRGSQKFRTSTSSRSYESVSRGRSSTENLPALFKNGGLELLRPGLAKEAGFLEVYPRGHRKPYLLEQLELFLEQKLRICERMINQKDKAFTSPTGEVKLANIKAIAQNLHLDAHRQCFEMFINAFNTYRPLLQRIKNQFEAALDNSLKSEQDNILLRQQLSMAETEKLRAIDEARSDAAAAAADQRNELARRLTEAETRMRAAELQSAEAQEEAKQAKQLAAEAMTEANTLREQNKALKQRMLDEASWAKKPLAEATGAVMVGARKTTDEEPPAVGAEDSTKDAPGA